MQDAGELYFLWLFAWSLSSVRLIEVRVIIAPLHPSLMFLLDFVMTLNKCRIGQLDTTTVDFFKSLQCPIDATFLPHIDPIYLFPTRKFTS